MRHEIPISSSTGVPSSTAADRSSTSRPRSGVDLYRQLLSVVPQHNLQVFVRGIHKKRHRNRAVRRRYSPDHPHRLGFMFLVERIDRWLEEIQPDGPEDRPLYGLLVADEQRSVERDIIESLPHWRESGTDFGFRKIRYLLDTLHTVPSHDSWLIQLVDCLAYLTNRQHRVDFSQRREAELPLLGVHRPCRTCTPVTWPRKWSPGTSGPSRILGCQRTRKSKGKRPGQRSPQELAVANPLLAASSNWATFRLVSNPRLPAGPRENCPAVQLRPATRDPDTETGRGEGRAQA